MPSSNPCTDPIFILGIMPRSGTNFLMDLLCLHPHCQMPSYPFDEDYFTHNAELLVKYAKAVYNNLRRQGKRSVDAQIKSVLLQSMANGLLSHLQSRIDGEKRLITKTPSVRNLKHFFKLFPSARLAIIVRDGRSVVESSVKSFGWSYENAMQLWVYAARNILRFQKTYKNSDYKYLIVKYEDLCNNLEDKLNEVLAFLDLETDVYNFEAAYNLPVRGSSVLRGNADKVTWKPLEKPQDFHSLPRWTNWDRNLHERFNWIAGDCMTAFGYEIQTYETIGSFGMEEINL